MKETGIFYGSSSGNTENVALRIHSRLGEKKTELRNIAGSSVNDLLNYQSLILGVPTWGIGELQEDWAEFLPDLLEADLTGIKVALFGLGDQESYPDTFADALGTLYESLLRTGCEIIGKCSTAGYEFTASAAVRHGFFVGLILDEENQSQVTEYRIENWLHEITPVFRVT